jgi:hypothetical protein
MCGVVYQQARGIAPVPAGSPVAEVCNKLFSPCNQDEEKQPPRVWIAARLGTNDAGGHVLPPSLQYCKDLSKIGKNPDYTRLATATAKKTAA